MFIAIATQETRNKSKNKDLYDKYKCNDLYKCFITTIITTVCEGGIIIIPLNFLSSIRKADIALRKHFLERYSIQIVNIFEEQVFDDTSYAVCSIYFMKKTPTDKELALTHFIEGFATHVAARQHLTVEFYLD